MSETAPVVTVTLTATPLPAATPTPPPPLPQQQDWFQLEAAHQAGCFRWLE
ncbi:MAG: hypothetical protein HS114_24830 [Anaerolineales bacterium]|nr:hypothetical protein [Anaerolineales bacterium]